MLTFPPKGAMRMAVICEDDVLRWSRPSAVVGKFPHVRSPECGGPHADRRACWRRPDERSTPASRRARCMMSTTPCLARSRSLSSCSRRPRSARADIAEEVKRTGPRAYIHIDSTLMLIFTGRAPQVNGLQLPSEPWLFVIDAPSGSRDRGCLQQDPSWARTRSTRPTPLPASTPLPAAQRRRGRLRCWRLPAGRLPRLACRARPPGR